MLAMAQQSSLEPPFPVLSAAGLAWAVAQGATAGRWSTRRGPSRPAGRRHAGRPGWDRGGQGVACEMGEITNLQRCYDAWPIVR